MTTRSRRRDGGYAMAAAVIVALGFAHLAFAVVADSRGTIAGAQGQFDRARLEAAAEAGLATTVHALGRADPMARPGLDGRPRTMTIDGMRLTVVVEDERGKLPLGRLSEEQIDRLLEELDVTGSRARQVRDSLLDWLDEDDEARLEGAESLEYADRDRLPRNGTVRDLDELAEVEGMDADLLERLRPALTLYFGDQGGFSPSTASPLALRAWGSAADSPAAIERERILAGQTEALEERELEDLIGRPLTIRILAEDGRGGRLQRATIVEFTGGDPAVWVRAVG